MSRVDAPEPIAYPARILSERGPVNSTKAEVRSLPNRELIKRTENK